MQRTKTRKAAARRPLRGLTQAGLLGTALLTAAAPGRLGSTLYAQVTNGSISGTVLDTTGAIIPNASVTVVNQANGDKRSSKTNNSGDFSFVGLPSGDFSVSITAPGFQTLTTKGVHLDPGDSRTVPNLKLETGQASQVVTVEGQTDVPLDTGERSDLITAEEIKHLSVEGRDVTELFKTLPGFAISNGNGGVSNSAYDPSQVSVNGALGSYAANGNPINGISLKLDGANITDPGNYGAAIQNVNYDQVAEVKVQVSNFGADIANGPVVVNAVTRSGTDHYHGELYTYARTYQLDSTDALNKVTGLSKAPDREIYPGFAVGGPILIPGTSFNKSRALTFFAGAEDYAQRNIYAYGNSANALVHALVPTANMRAGNFSASELQNYLGPQLYADPNYANIAAVPTFAKDNTPIVNGMIPTKYQDPGFAAIWANWPLPNAVATSANPYNWQSQDLINNDLWQAIGRVDIAISQRNHLFGRYSVERGASGVPATIYYNPGELNSAGGGQNTINSESAAANLTTIISPTLTNQVYGDLAYLNSSYGSQNLSALTAYPYQGAFANGRHVLPQIQSYNDYAGLPRQLTQDYALGPIFAHKFDPEGGDTLTAVFGKHTLSTGVFVERITNNQRTPFITTNGAIPGEYYFPAAGAPSTDVDGATNYLSGNWVANNFEGFTAGYTQQNTEPQTNLYFWNTDFFVNDSWKVTSRVTVNYGVRFEHLGLWNDARGQGLAVFYPNLITSGASNSPYPGFLWHGIDPAIPNAGNNAYPLLTEPRLGFAWDVRGNGSTVLRGGWGEYRAHDAWNDVSNANSLTQFSTTVSPTFTGAATLGGISRLNLPVTTVTPPNTATFSTTGSFYALNPNDREQPLTDTYSVTLNQNLPYHINALVGYVGNNSRFLLNDGSNQTVALDNVNALPIGALYKPNPDSGSAQFGQVLQPVGQNPAGQSYSNYVNGIGTAQTNQYRPLNTPNVQYGAIDMPTHNLFANYNSLQLGLARQTGRVLFNLNYTYSKALGVQGGYNNGEPGNPFNLYDDYGPLNFDRRQIFNATYTFEVGNPVKNKLVGEFTNGWELSGITTYQSGPDLSILTSNPGFALSGNIGPTGSTTQIPITNTVFLGTPDVSLQPVLTCNPRSNLASHQYINGACFATPGFLQNGPYQLPYLAGPAYFDTDLSAQKAFNFGKEQNITFRVSAFNFVNHALNSFTTSFSNEYTLNLTNLNGTTFNQGAFSPSSGFGVAPYETGRRVVELMAKYNF